MKKALKTSALLIVWFLIIPLSAWAGLDDLFIVPAALTGSGGGAVNFNAKMLTDPALIDSNHFDINQNHDSNKFFINSPLGLLIAVPNEMSGITLKSLTASPNKPRPENRETSIGISAVVIPDETRSYRDAASNSGTIQTAMRSKDTDEAVGPCFFTDPGEARIYSTSFTEFGMVKKVLEPTTMLLLGSCLLGIGLFAIKFRK